MDGLETGPAAESHPPSGRLRYLDGWRAIAIGGVLVDHFVTSRGLNLGRVGVELFFVLSGRLMAQILFIEALPLGYFYFRRFTRVWPALAVLIAVLSGVSLFWPLQSIGWLGIVGSLTFTQNYLSVFVNRSFAVDHIWSLCVEEHTYLFLGAVALLARRKAVAVLPVLLGVIVLNQLDGWISTVVFHQNYYLVYWRTDTRMASILMGAAAYLASQRGRLRLGGMVPLGLFAAGLLLNADRFPDPIKYSAGTACLALAVANLDRDTTILKWGLSLRLPAFVGMVSYSIYLWQQPFMGVPRIHNVNAVGIVLAVAVGLCSFYLVENPLRLWFNARAPAWARRPGPGTAGRNHGGFGRMKA